MLENFSGATRVHMIVGDPIAQVKSPLGVTQAFEKAGLDAVCVPAHVAAADLKTWFAGVSASRNVDGIIVTVPHKFSAFDYCKTTSGRAGFLHAVNTMRRNPDGSWHGDMFDGLGYVTALQNHSCPIEGSRALLVGAGGAGSAIAYSLILAGVSELAICDPDDLRRENLINKLNLLGKGKAIEGSNDATGFNLVLNASPIGMKPGDPMPVLAASLKPSMFVGCVITSPAVPALIEKARALGCNTITGADMFAQVRELMVQFLTE